MSPSSLARLSVLFLAAAAGSQVPPEVAAAQACVERAADLARSGELARARSLVSTEVAKFRETTETSDGVAAHCLGLLSLGAEQLYDYATARAGWRAFAARLADQRARRNDVLGARLQEANACLMMGDLDEARTIAESVCQAVPMDHDHATSARYILLQVFDAEGNLARAVAVGRDALRAARSRNDIGAEVEAKLFLAQVLSRSESKVEAVRLAEEAIAVIVARRTPMDLDLAEQRVVLGEAYARAGRLDAAEAVFLEAIRACESTDGLRAESIARRARTRVAVSYANAGKVERAHDLLEALVAEMSDPRDDDAFRVLQTSASVLYSLGRLDEARPRMKRAVALARERLTAMTGWLSLGEQEKAHESLHELVSSLLSCRDFEQVDSAQDREDLESVLAFRGLLSRHARKVALLRARGDEPEVARALAASHRARAAWREASSAGRPELATPLAEERDRAERALLDLMGQGEIESSAAEASLANLSALLPERVVAIETFRYLRYQPIEEGQLHPDPIEHFAAFMIRRNGDTRRVELGTAASLGEAALAFRATLRSAGADADRGRPTGRPEKAAGPRASGALSEALRPLLALIPSEVDSLFVCPDGELAAIPWQALRLENGTLVVDKHRVIYGEDLRALQAPASAPASPSLLVMGGVDYGSGAQGAWSALAGAEAETRMVRAAFQSVHATANVVALSGSDATVGAFVESAPRCRVLHVATHGFARADLDDRDDRHGESAAGLVFANANELGDRGVLYAGDLAGLDLSSCELAVLSACNTNQGGVRRFGDAVAGLNRALHLAGAHATLTTLWPIPDRAAESFIGWFYQALWTEGHSINESFAVAVRRAKGALPASVWAGFVLYSRP